MRRRCELASRASASGYWSSRLELSFSLPPQKKLSQRHSIVVNLVLGGEDDCDRHSSCQRAQRVELFPVLACISPA
jgi:hypothetical protein